MNEYKAKQQKHKKMQLVIHHIKELEHHSTLVLDIDNLEKICVDYHNRKHGSTFKKVELFTYLYLVCIRDIIDI
ncbi:HNH endonuclease [Bacillus cereus]|nr:HNH endonuclease [Bacillus cereus]